MSSLFSSPPPQPPLDSRAPCILGCVGQVGSDRQAEQSAPVMTACLCEYTFLSSPPPLLPLPSIFACLRGSFSTLPDLSAITPSFSPCIPCWSPVVVNSSSALVTPRWPSHPSQPLPVSPHCHAYVSKPKSCPSVSVPNSSSVSFCLLSCHTPHHHHPASVPHPSLPFFSTFLSVFVLFSPNKKIHLFQTHESFIFIFLRYMQPVCSLIFSSLLVVFSFIHHLSVSASSLSKPDPLFF